MMDALMDLPEELNKDSTLELSSKEQNSKSELHSADHTTELGSTELSSAKLCSGDMETYFTERLERERKRRRLRGLLRRLILTAIVVYALFGIIGGIAIVQGVSMEPSVSSQSVIFFNRLGSAYTVEDIVLLQAQGQTVIKRVVAVAGDTVDFDSASGELLINGQKEQRLSTVGQTLSRGDTEYPLTIPRGYVFVLGDNREDSVDSRDFGLVSITELIGKALFMMRTF